MIDLLSDPVWYALAFLTSFGLALYVTPLTIRVAKTFKIQDTPDGRLKKHTEPTPYLGGLAVAAAFVIAFGLLSTTPTTRDQAQAMGILSGGFMVLLLGLYDDLSNLRPSVKFLGQLLAAIVLWKAGVRVEISDLSTETRMLLTILWVTGITNAFNIIDVMDGLAGGTALIAAVFLFVISALVGGHRVVPFMAITLAGALMGYLRYNYHPARIFLGDTGSLFIGFMLGALSMVVSYSDPNRLAIFTPVVLLAIPIFDTVFVAIHRSRKGIPFFKGSPDHFALRLRHRGLDVPTVVRRTYCVAVCLGVVSLALVFGHRDRAPWMLVGFAVAVLAAFFLLSRVPAPDGRSGSGSEPSPADEGDG